jgi:drug/metabolite transporter (DMT)-like permease
MAEPARIPFASRGPGGLWIGLGLLVLTTLLWGSTFPLVQGAVARIPPLSFLAWRFGLAGMLLAPFLRGPFSRLRDGLAVGLANALGFLLQTFALTQVDADTVAFLTGLSVILVPVGESLLWRKMPSGRLIGALVLGLAGLILVTLGSGGTASLRPGDVWGALCAVAFAVQVLGTSHLARRLPPLEVAAQEVVAGAVVFVVVALAVHPGWLAPPPPSGWWVVLYTAVATTVGTFFLQTMGQARVSATVAALTFNLEPVFAAMWAYLLLGQSLTLPGAVGALCILAGMVLAALLDPPDRRKDPGPVANLPLGSRVTRRTKA